MPARPRKRSAAVDLTHLEGELAKGRFHPIYLVLGSEALLAEQAVEAIVEACVASEARDFNLNVYSGDDESAKQFLSQAESYPFMAQRRAVIVRRFEKMSFAQVRAEKALMAYLANPVESTVLVLVATKLDRRTRIAQAVQKASHVVDVEELPEQALPGWVCSRFAKHGLRAEPQACARLVQLVGNVLLDLRNEVDKVAIRFAENDRIDESDVATTVGRYREEEVWAINRAFRPQNMSGFMAALARVLAADDAPIRVCAVMARHVNQLLRIKLLESKGLRASGEIGRHMKLPPFIVQQQITQAEDFSKKQLVLWLRNLQRADVQMKSLRLPQRWVFERALLNSFLGQEMA